MIAALHFLRQKSTELSVAITVFFCLGYAIGSQL